jgi:hypothetical protein
MENMKAKRIGDLTNECNQLHKMLSYLPSRPLRELIEGGYDKIPEHGILFLYANNEISHGDGRIAGFVFSHGTRKIRNRMETSPIVESAKKVYKENLELEKNHSREELTRKNEYKPLTDYDENNIFLDEFSYKVLEMNDTAKKTEELESRMMATITNCRECYGTKKSRIIKEKINGEKMRGHLYHTGGHYSRGLAHTLVLTNGNLRTIQERVKEQVEALSPEKTEEEYQACPGSQ